MTSEEKAFDRGLAIGMVSGFLMLGALLWAASPTEAEKLDHCTDVVWESKNR